MADVPVTVTKPDGTALAAGWVVKATKNGARASEAKPDAGSLSLAGDGQYAVEVSMAPDGFKKPPAQPVTVASDRPTPATVTLRLELAPATVAIAVIGPDDSRTVDKWNVDVTDETDSKVSKSAEDSKVELPRAGHYTFALTEVGPRHVLPAVEYRSKTVEVTGTEKLAATVGGSIVDKDTPVSWSVSAVQDSKATGPLITVEAALMALVAVGFWTFVITLDPDPDGLGLPLLAILGFFGLVIFAAACWQLRYLVFSKSSEAHDPGWSPVAVVIGILMVVAAFGLKGSITLTEGQRFAIATGGVAIAAFVIGLLRFDTVKAAASLPIVVLFIGLAAWPSGATNMDPDVQQTLITAMGAILGIAAVGEAVQQATNNIANARVKAAEAAMGGSPENVSTTGTGPGKPVSRPRGDMTRADDT
jgi:hypothetical protein